jgi:hypothetical protein
MQLFNKFDKASKLFSKVNDAKNSFKKFISDSNQSSHAKVGHFITSKPSNNNSIERGIRKQPENTVDNMFV